MISTRMGSAITITSAAQLDIPVDDYSLRNLPEYPIHYGVWFFQGVYVSDQRPLYGGHWEDANALVADGGWRVIEAELNAKKVDASTVAADIRRHFCKVWRDCGEKKRAARFEAMTIEGIANQDPARLLVAAE